MISPRHLQVAENNIIAVQQAKRPRIETDMVFFIGLYNVYRWFIKGFAKIVAPFNRNLHKRQPDQFGVLEENESHAFQKLKAMLISSAMLTLPKSGYHYTLGTDATNTCPDASGTRFTGEVRLFYAPGVLTSSFAAHLEKKI